MRAAVFAVFCISFAQGLLAQSSDDVFEKVGDDTDRWIELQMNLSKETSLWHSEKTILENSIRVLDNEKEALEKSLESNRLASGLYLKNEETLAAQIETQNDALDFVRQELDTYRMQALAVAKRLPGPIKKDIDALIPKLAVEFDDQPVSIANRMQSLISILTMIDHFGNSLTLTHEIRRDGAGGSYDTRVLYWGLAMGYAVNTTASRAWLLSPEDEQWVWNEISGKAETVRALIDVYENNRTPSLITLPATLN